MGLEENDIRALDGGHQHGPVQIFVAPLARRFWGEQAGMAGGGVQRDAVAVGMMLGTERVAGAQAHGVQGLIEMPLQRLRLAEGHQPAERAFAVRRGGIDQHARHLRLVLAGLAGVDAFPQRGRGIAALDRQLPDQAMGKRVQQDKADAGVELVRRLQLPGDAPALVRFIENGIEGLALVPPTAGSRSSLKWKKRPSPRISEAGTQVGGCGTILARWLGGKRRRIVVVARGLNAGEADEGTDFAQPLGQHDLLEILGVAVRRR